jgi:hypothetical protein
MYDKEYCVRIPTDRSEQELRRRLVDITQKPLHKMEMPELAFFLGVKGHSIAGQAVNSAFQHSVMFPQMDLYSENFVMPDLILEKDLSQSFA